MGEYLKVAVQYPDNSRYMSDYIACLRELKDQVKNDNYLGLSPAKVRPYLEWILNEYDYCKAASTYHTIAAARAQLYSIMFAGRAFCDSQPSNGTFCVAPDAVCTEFAQEMADDFKAYDAILQDLGLAEFIGDNMSMSVLSAAAQVPFKYSVDHAQS